MYRRPLLALLQAVFHEGASFAPDKVFRLSGTAASELLSLVMLAPVAFTNLRAEPSGWLYATDASLYGAGVVRTWVGSVAAQELLRFTGRIGCHTKLEPRLSAFLKEWAGHSPNGAIVHEAVIGSAPPTSLLEGIIWDTAEVFCGEGNWGRAALRCHTVPGVARAPRLGQEARRRSGRHPRGRHVLVLHRPRTSRRDPLVEPGTGTALHAVRHLATSSSP